jgi:hypothetical protein
MSELWSWIYKRGFSADGDPRKAAGILAMKEELIYNGYGSGIDTTVQIFGWSAVNETELFQKANGLSADGEIGPITARVLFRKRTKLWESKLNIPNDYLAKLLQVESEHDPVAQGVTDPNDEGMAQINLPSHPSITQEQAWSPAFAIQWAGGYLIGLFTATGGSDWDCALAAYNVGTSLADQWCAAGKPATGGPVIGTNPDGTPIYAWTTITTYLRVLKGEPV